MSYDLRLSPKLVEIALAVRDFVEHTVIPMEGALRTAEHGVAADVVQQLRSAARAASVFAPTVARELGGLGLDHRSSSVVLEEAGRSLLGPAALNCAAPDEGNMALLHQVASPAQRSLYLAPLASGEVRSTFAMTEPSPGAGSDPNHLVTRADRTGHNWVLNGTKWFTTGALGASFCIVMAQTNSGATMFLVDSANPGMHIQRQLNTMDRAFVGGHCIVSFNDCTVSEDDVLGEVGQGFKYAQVRLGPARLTHCMRWLGAARRAHEVAVNYAIERTMFSSQLANLGMAQQLIADNEIDIAAARQLIWSTAGALDAGQPARHETSICKTFVSEAVFRIVDRSMQLCGGSGTLAELPIAQIFSDARAFRIYDGPSEVHRMSISKRAVRRSSDGSLPGDWQ